MEKKLLTALFFIITVGLAGFAVTHPGSLFPALILAAVAAMVLITQPKLLLFLVVCTETSGVRLLGVGGRLPLFAVFFAVAACYGILHRALTPRRLPRDLSDRGLLIFSITIIMLICVHGFGLSLAGSSSYGGKTYIVLLFAMMAYKAVQSINLNERQTRNLVYCFTAASCLPVTTQVLIYFNPSLYTVLDHFVNTNADYLVGENAGGGAFVTNEIVRWQGVTFLAVSLWFLTVAKLWQTRRRWLLYAIFGLLATLAFLAGFRSAATAQIMLSVIALIATSRQRWQTVMSLAGLAVAGYLLLIAIGPQLSLSIQRSLSFLPGINWAPEVIISGEGTMNWRLDVWALCWRNVPQHLFIGRGLLLENVMSHAWLSRSYYMTPEFYYATHGYHSGPLSLLLDTGLPGLIGFFMFQIGMVLNAFRYFRSSAGSSNLFLRGYMLALTISTTYRVFSYYLAFGDIVETLPRLIINGILIWVVGETLLKQKAEAAVAAEVRDQEPAVRGGRTEDRGWKSSTTASPAFVPTSYRVGTAVRQA